MDNIEKHYEKPAGQQPLPSDPEAAEATRDFREKNRQRKFKESIKKLNATIDNDSNYSIEHTYEEDSKRKGVDGNSELSQYNYDKLYEDNNILKNIREQKASVSEDVERRVPPPTLSSDREILKEQHDRILLLEKWLLDQRNLASESLDGLRSELNLYSEKLDNTIDRLDHYEARLGKLREALVRAVDVLCWLLVIALYLILLYLVIKVSKYFYNYAINSGWDAAGSLSIIIEGAISVLAIFKIKKAHNLFKNILIKAI